ncbi:methyltransferase domain-containing protein [Xylariomycetidae sp. FL2044]|nr:methyltransferase domain-containing protein [Xylariomycetidae sp. FL2044]
MGAIQPEASYIARSHAITNIADMRALYNNWATTYESDVNNALQDYVAPRVAVRYLLESLGSPSIPADLSILDAGCGTGLVGTELVKNGAKTVVGVDLSPGMLDEARKRGVYQKLEVADLSQRLVFNDSSYSVVMCIGTMTQAHVGPGVIAEFARIVKSGGLVVASVLESIWESGGYRAQVDGLVKEGKIELLRSQLEDYRKGVGIRAEMIAFKVV